MLGACVLKEEADRKARFRAEQELLNREKKGRKLSCGWEHSVESMLHSTLHHSRNLVCDNVNIHERIFHPPLQYSNHHNVTRLFDLHSPHPIETPNIDQ